MESSCVWPMVSAMANLDNHNMAIFSVIWTAAVLLLFLIGLALNALNINWLTQPLRMPGLGVNEVEKLRFVQGVVWDSKTSLNAIANPKSVTESSKLTSRGLYFGESRPCSC